MTGVMSTVSYCATSAVMSPIRNSFASVPTTASAEKTSPAERERNTSMPKSTGSTSTISASRSTTTRSTSVVVGDLSSTVSVSTAREQDARHRERDLDAELLVARRDDGRGRADRQVEEEDRAGGLDVADAVVVDDLDDGRVLDAGGRLRGLVVVDEHHPPASATRHVGSREDADDPVGLVDDDRLAVRAGDEVLGGDGEQRLGADRRHFGVDEVAHGVRERDAARCDVGVKRRDHDRRALGASEFDDVVGGAEAAARDQARDAGLERHRLRAQPVARDDRVARREPRDERARLVGGHEHVAGDERLRIAADDLALERARDDVDGDRHAPEALDAGLVQVALGEHALAHEPGRAAVRVDDRQRPHAAIEHEAAGREHRLVDADRDRTRRS